jgi:cobalt-zinc-cadmium efflux system membrane fusion protein
MKNSKHCLTCLLIVVLSAFSTGCESGAKTSNVAPSLTADTQSKVPRVTASTEGKVLKLDGPMVSQIKTEELSEESIPKVLTTTGKVQFNEDQIARILVPVNGQVLHLSVKVGDTVQKGQILFFINSREVGAAVTEHLESHKDLDLAEKTYAMTKDLFEHQAASRISLQQAESDLAKAKARVARTEEALRVLGEDIHESDSLGDMSSRIPVRSTLTGTVIERRVTEGQFVQPDSNPLLTIADLSSLWVLADIFERDLHSVQVGQKAEVKTEAYPEHSFVARVSRISDVIDPSSRTIKVRFLVSNPGSHLKPEMFASVNLFLQESIKGLTVPAKAVFTEAGRNFVFVRVGEREFVRRPVEVLPDGSTRLRVSHGLSPGDQVVSEGALLLMQQEKQQKEG